MLCRDIIYYLIHRIHQDEDSSSSSSSSNGGVSSNLEGIMSVDCKLGVPSLRISCSESADLSSCHRQQKSRGGENNNFDTSAIDGLEIWSRIVIAPGLSQGKTCEEVSMEQNVVSLIRR
jgi:hypothetical protein